MEVQEVPKSTPVLLTTEEAAARLRCHVVYVRKICREGKLGFVPRGLRYMIPEAEIEKYIAAELEGGS